MTFDANAQVVDLFDIRRFELADKEATARMRDQQALLLEQPCSLADRSAADAGTNAGAEWPPHFIRLKRTSVYTPEIRRVCTEAAPGPSS